MSMMPAESSAHDHSELNGGSVFTLGCSPMLEGQQYIDVKGCEGVCWGDYARGARRANGRCGSWRKSLSIMRGMMKSCMLPKPKIRGARDLGNHAIMEDQLPLLPRQSLVFLFFVLN
jgi:hypothetical protein